jgi:hypothetical protein
VIGRSGPIFGSYNGVEWSLLNSEDSVYYAIIWVGERFIAVGRSNYSPHISTSSDGINWSQESILTDGVLEDIASSGQQVVVVERRGLLSQRTSTINEYPVSHLTGLYKTIRPLQLTLFSIYSCARLDSD